MVELNFKPGDNVRLRLALEELDGRVLESPDSSIILLKLKSGYNIGVPKENILAGRVLKKFTENPAGEFQLPKSNESLPKIGIIITGGTMAAKLDTRTGGVKHIVNIEEFFKYYPELFALYKFSTFFLLKRFAKTSCLNLLSKKYRPSKQRCKSKSKVCCKNGNFRHSRSNGCWSRNT